MSYLLNRQIFHELELVQIAVEVKSICPRGSILLLSGDLAAGKTTFVSKFCEQWGLRLVQSPTYAIHQRYQNEDLTVDHFDLYRLESEEEIESAGVYDLLAQPADYKIIEWPERLNQADLPLGNKLYSLTFQVSEDGSRTIRLQTIEAD